MSPILFLAALCVQPGPVVVEASDDVWVYSFAQDQAGDEFLRAWGAPEGAVSAPGEGMAFSYSLLKFELPEGLAAPRSAKLVVTHVADAKFTAEESKASPLECRLAPPGFEEETWEYGMHPQFLPEAGGKAVLGTGWGAPGGDKPFAIEIDLMAGPKPFADALKDALARPGRTLALALTTTLRPDEAGDGRLYKLYSRHNESALRPKLVLGG